MTRKPFVVPSIGESVVEVGIGRWLKKAGDTVVEGERLVELEGDKANVEIESPFTGVLSEIVAQQSDVVPIGAVLAYIDESPAPRPAVVTPPAASPAREVKAPVERVAPRAAPEPSFAKARPAQVGRLRRPEDRATHVVILGAGTAGFAAAMRLAQLDRQVTLVDPSPIPGGRAFRGGAVARRCVLAFAARHRMARAALESSGQPGGLAVSMAAVRDRAREVESTFSRGLISLLKARRVDLLRGIGRVRAGRRVDVLDPEGRVLETIEAGEVILATGTVPFVPPGVTIDGSHVVVDGGPLDFAEVPRRLAVIGGGTTALEWAVAFAGLGSHVTVLYWLPRLLHRLDNDVLRHVEQWLARSGVHLCLDARVLSTHREGDAVVTKFARGDEHDALITERVLVAAVRRPAGEGVADEDVQLELSKGAFVVDAQQHTTAEGVWAIGGAARDRRRPSHGAMDAVALAERIVGTDVPAAHRLAPEVIHLGTLDIAWVGASEAELVADGVPHRVGKAPFLANTAARATGTRDGVVKLLVHAGSDRVLGAQIVGPAAGERIDEVALAMSLGASADDLARLPRASGTLAEALGEAARAACGWPLMLLR